ncbi:hypothetical protein X793_06820 [Dehalococcoides mccartyi CG4]|nr:hypothetical protein X793_06820 [Dehalococcoides mccartyi CG4]
MAELSAPKSGYFNLPASSAKISRYLNIMWYTKT